MLVVDPMHNLFLGSAKHYMKLKNDILSDVDFASIQERVDAFLLPADVGRIPYKMKGTKVQTLSVVHTLYIP